MKEKTFLLDVLKEFKESICLSNDVEISCKPKGCSDWFIFKYKKGLGIYASIMNELFMELIKEDRFGSIDWKDFMMSGCWGIDWKDIDIDGDGKVDGDGYIKEFIDSVLGRVDFSVLSTGIEVVLKVVEKDESGNHVVK